MAKQIIEVEPGKFKTVETKIEESAVIDLRVLIRSRDASIKALDFYKKNSKDQEVKQQKVIDSMTLDIDAAIAAGVRPASVNVAPEE